MSEINDTKAKKIRFLYLQYINAKKERNIYLNRMKTTRSKDLHYRYKKIYIKHNRLMKEIESKIYSIINKKTVKPTGIEPFLR